MTTPLARLLVFVFVSLVALPVASAQDAETRAAKRYFERGQKAFNLGKFDDALEQYQKAYDAKPIPAILFNIGQCYRNLGDYEAAIFSFRKYLKLEPDADNRTETEEYIAELEAEQQKDNSRKLGFEDERKKRKRGEEPTETGAPVYKKWWFWTGIAVVGAAGGIGIYAATRADGPPMTKLGNIEY